MADPKSTSKRKYVLTKQRKYLRPMSAEHRAKLSAAMTGRVRSPEHCANISAGRKSIGTGTPLSADHRAKISAALRGKAKASTHVAAVAAALKGRRGIKPSAETRAKLSAIRTGKRRSKFTPEEQRQRAIERVRLWALAHPERVRALGRRVQLRRRARKAKAFVDDVDPRVVYLNAEGICGICREPIDPTKKWHVDHIVPLSKGGAHSYANTQPAHAACNHRKGAKVA